MEVGKMVQDIYYYLQQLHRTMMMQEKRIKGLEGLVTELQDELDNLKKKPPITVEKIEYKFDQLKVETLEGTLNIGLNPSDLQGIDSVEVNTGLAPNPLQSDPKNQFRFSMELEEELYQRLETDLPQLIANAETKINQKLKEDFYGFIKEDIRKQIPSRVQHYLTQSPFRGNDEERESWKQNIIGQLLREMENGICTFINNLPDNMKG
jgi:spore germination protein PC